jgi:hypothetical protein
MATQQLAVGTHRTLVGQQPAHQRLFAAGVLEPGVRTSLAEITLRGGLQPPSAPAVPHAEVIVTSPHPNAFFVTPRPDTFPPLPREMMQRPTDGAEAPLPLSVSSARTCTRAPQGVWAPPPPPWPPPAAPSARPRAAQPSASAPPPRPAAPLLASSSTSARSRRRRRLWIQRPAKPREDPQSTHEHVARRSSCTLHARSR